MASHWQAGEACSLNTTPSRGCSDDSEGDRSGMERDVEDRVVAMEAVVAQAWRRNSRVDLCHSAGHYQPLVKSRPVWVQSMFLSHHSGQEHPPHSRNGIHPITKPHHSTTTSRWRPTPLPGPFPPQFQHLKPVPITLGVSRDQACARLPPLSWQVRDSNSASGSCQAHIARLSRQ